MVKTLFDFSVGILVFDFSIVADQLHVSVGNVRFLRIVVCLLKKNKVIELINILD